MSFVSDQATRDNSIQFGRTVGDAILLARKQEGAKNQVSYVPGSDPGDWNRTEPDRLPPLLPQWPQVQPFAITNTMTYRPAPPPTLDSQEYANAVDQVHSIPGLHRRT